ncbi:MAG: recombination protein RecR [Phycisphaerae bacterium]|jgi:recombination protein RecR|nr:recombination protein RecR [Phycisphaerae bacterium]MBT6269215.1 recombination protein RecR [Phycisphaerae bacterium]MBT6282932.1 recombination protein RecR [Phycisphaerae bacterium]
MSLRDSKGTPEPVRRLLDSLARLPGIGKRGAERIAFHLIKDAEQEAIALSAAIADVKHRVVCCDVCNNIADASPCAICDDASRDASIVLVVEQPRDLIRLEATGMFRGIYHVLTGRIDPLAGVEPSDLTVDALLHRVDKKELNARGVQIKEVIFGLNPNLEGDSTSLYLASQLTSKGIAVTRLARGLPSGSQIEYANTQVLSDAIAGRQGMR